jgi:small subunit ribosomal protein S9
MKDKMEILARSIGRRKEAIATLKIVKGTGKFLINNKTASDYLHNNSNNLMSIQAPLQILQKHSSGNSNLNSTESSQNSVTDFDVLVKVEGGGLVGQAEAIKLAVARAVCLLKSNVNSETLKKSLKDRGYLTQDARVKERRKYGLRKARKAPQYNKR